MIKKKIKILITQEEIQSTVKSLGRKITSDYKNLSKPIILIGILKGSFIFLADLCREIKVDVDIEFMGVSSYGNSTVSSGVVQITQDLTSPIKNRHVIIVEDIIDTGLTARYLLDNIRTRDPASLKICSLLEKPEKNKGNINIDYLGHSIPDKFVVGYGLDISGLHRNWPHIAFVE